MRIISASIELSKIDKSRIVEKDGKCIAAFTKNAKYDTKCNSILPYLENMRKVEFLGKEFNVPGDDYLEYLYGTTWKTPIKK